MGGVEDVQQRSDHQEQRKLDEDEDAADEQRLSGGPFAVAAQIPLDHELIGPMRCGREKRAADHAGPECVAAGEIEREIEHAQLVAGGCQSGDFVPASRDLLPEDERRGERADQIDGELDDVGPDERRHPAEEGVDDHGEPERHDGRHQQRVRRIARRHHRLHCRFHARHRDEERREDQRRGKQTEAVRERTGHEEQPGRQLLDRSAKSPLEQLIDGQHLAAEVRRHEDHAHNDPADDVPHRQLQEGVVGSKGVAGHADERHGARLGRDDRRHDHPPGQIAAADEVVLEVCLPSGEPGAQEDRAGEVRGDDGQVQRRHRSG